MEGLYYYNGNESRVYHITEKLKSEKERLKICSLSKSFTNQLMWSHYSTGHRGVVIGVRVDSTKYDLVDVTYEEMSTINESNYDIYTAKKILSRKHAVWKYEEEVRVFVSDKEYVEVVIEEIYTGSKMSNQDYSMIKKIIDKINSNIRINKM